MSYIGNPLPASFQSLPAVQRFNGNASTTAFTLAAAIANDQSILVSVDGVVQDSNAYSVSGTTLTFTAAPSSGTGNIFVNTISPVGSTLVPPDGSVTTAKVLNDAVTEVKTSFIDSSTGAIQLPTGTTAQRPGSPVTGQQRFNTTIAKVEVYNGTDWAELSGFASHSIAWLAVAGAGGGGGGSGGGEGGGGGAGGFRTSAGTSGGGASAESAISVTAQNVTYTVTIGAGGAGSSNSAAKGTSGSDTTIAATGLTTITCVGGGGGGSRNTSVQAGLDGGSGGGNGQRDGSLATSSGTSGQGFGGGQSSVSGGNGSQGGGGGGGAGAVGTTSPDNGVGGAGGVGVASTITGSSVFYAGGGGGGGSSGGAGGNGGGGAGTDTGNATAGTANTGGGGGGGGNGQAGGTGVVIFSIPTAYYSGTVTGSPTVTTSGSNTIVKFTASGTYVS